MAVNREKLKEAIIEILTEVDYDIYKEKYMDNDDEIDHLINLASEYIEVEH